MEETTPGRLEVSEIRARYVDRDDAVILDIGANDGTHTGKFLDCFPRATVYCFEPDQRAAARWRNRITSPRAHLFECALGSFEGDADFYVSSGQPPRKPQVTDFDQAGSLRQPKTCLERWRWLKFKEPTRVQVRTLDGWAREQGVDWIDFIWADVQGAESDLIDGGRATLRNVGYFYTEYSDAEWYEGQATLAQIIERLKEDFDPLVRWHADVLFRNKRLAA